MLRARARTAVDAVQRTALPLRLIGPRPRLLARYVSHRLTSRIQRKLVRRFYGLLVARQRSRELRPPPVSLPAASGLPAGLVAAAHTLRDTADAALAHRFDLLGSGPTHRTTIDWHEDFKSGYVWPRSFYQDVAITRLDDASDAKVPWELSRAHHLVVLARAAALFDDARYARELEAQLADWLDANPPGQGINWTNPMEVAIRAVNWLVAVATLDGTAYQVTAPLRERLARSLAAHAAHVRLNLEGTPLLRSNHYLSDILGLLAIGASLEGRRPARWFAYARRAFEAEIQNQVQPDGSGAEASLPYHGLVLEIFLVARWIALSAGRPLSASYDQRLAAMLTASASLRHPNGRMPQTGDGDSGRILPPTNERRPTHDNLIWIGAAMLGAPSPLPGPPDHEVAWLLGVPAWERAGADDPSSQPVRDAFPDGGLYVLRSGPTGVHVVVRCGDVGQNGNGGHSHNDQLSYELSCGATLIQDAGTYVYTSDPATRNAFRSSQAHNVLIVDGEEPNPIPNRSLFTLPQRCITQITRFQACGSDGGCLEAFVEHTTGPLAGTLIRREFVVAPSGIRLGVTDRVEGSGRHELRSLVHLAPRVAVTLDGDCATLRADGCEATIVFFGFADVALQTGWVSDAYGIRTRASVLCGTHSGPLPAQVGYRIEVIGQRAPGPPDDVHRRSAGRSG